MYDTVNFWLEISTVGFWSADYYLSDIVRGYDGIRGDTLTGKIDNYTALLTERGLSLKGSLSKFYHGGSNVNTLTRESTREAIERLSDRLHLNIAQARVARLDFSTVIQVKHNPPDYYRYLGEKRYFSRLLKTANTLCYDNHQRQLIFYDKTKEAAARGMEVPDLFKGKSLLRYEMRYHRRIKTQFGRDILASDLHDKDFYRTMVDTWHKEFKSIQKLGAGGYEITGIKTLKQAEAALFAHLLQQSGLSIIDDYIAALRAADALKRRQRYTDLKRKLNRLISSPKGSVGESELMQELEQKIKYIAKFAK